MASAILLKTEKPGGVRGVADTALKAVIRNTAGARLRMRTEEADKLARIEELVSIRAQDPTPLDPKDFIAAGKEHGVHPATVHALGNIEGGIHGFFETRIFATDGSTIADPGRMVPLVEPHLFSALTSHAWDILRPDLSYPNWVPNKKGAPPPGRFEIHPYNYDYSARWGLIAAMAEVDVDAAIGAASYGRFQQVVGSPRPNMGWKLLKFASAEALFRELAKSERAQLEIMFQFFKANGGMRAMRDASRPNGAANWRDLARIYNGPGQVDRYSKLLEAEFMRVKRFYQ